MKKLFALFLFATCASLVFAQTTNVRLMAANLNGDTQSYQDFALRIFKGLKPDVVCIQEFNYRSNSASDLNFMVTNTFGPGYTYYREADAAYDIPNGIISRYPILASGTWDDADIGNRGFAWAKLDLPGDKDLYVISAHLKSSSDSSSRDKRTREAIALKAGIRNTFPSGALIAIGGDFNLFSETEPCITNLTSILNDTPVPVGADGDADTNLPRSRRYDRILTSPELTALFTPVRLGTNSYPTGLVFVSTNYVPLTDIAPIQYGDSLNAQHMAVIKDFAFPVTTTPTNPPIVPPVTNPPVAPKPPSGLRVIGQ